MFCRNCGGEMNDNQAICLNCGVKTGKGKAYCSNCGNAVAPEADVCMSCGIAINKAVEKSSKSKVAAGLLALFLGTLGIHWFYLGDNKKGIIYLLVGLLGGMVSCGIASVVIGILAIIDGIRIFMGNINDVNGAPLSD